MTYDSLLTAIFENRDVFFVLWKEEMKEAKNRGAFVFLAEGYENVDSLDDVAFSFWPFAAIREALTQHDQRDDPMDDLLQDIDFDLEFLIVALESSGNENYPKVHIDIISRVGLN